MLVSDILPESVDCSGSTNDKPNLHRDTLSYLLDRITGLLGNPESVVTIHDGTNRDERRKNQEEFRNNPGQGKA